MISYKYVHNSFNTLYIYIYIYRWQQYYIVFLRVNSCFFTKILAIFFKTCSSQFSTPYDSHYLGQKIKICNLYKKYMLEL